MILLDRSKFVLFILLRSCLCSCVRLVGWLLVVDLLLRWAFCSLIVDDWLADLYLLALVHLYVLLILGIRLRLDLVGGIDLLLSE